MRIITNSGAGVVPTKHQSFWQYGNFVHPPQQKLLKPVWLQQENGLQIATTSSLMTEGTAMCEGV
jgi:hypothetical protein